jgi:hypothetical protein
MNPLNEIQEWYYSQCNGDWEHSYGVKISNLDNPGWAVNIDLCETELEDIDFPQYSYGLEEHAESSGDDWLLCRRIGNSFEGRGGPYKLTEILDTFLKWAHENRQCESGPGE